jgi:flagellar hook-associated protein 1 FlgK
MGIANVFQTGVSGMAAAKTSIATTGHNITNANTEGYSRQRTVQAPEHARAGLGKHIIGQGVRIDRVERQNDLYLEKQLRESQRDLAHAEEKDILLRQTENAFNEMNGDGLNRLMSNFFNEFRKLSNEPDSEALRQSVRESSQAMVNDFKRIRKEVMDVSGHIDARLEGMVLEANSVAEQIKNLNIEIQKAEISGASPNDLLDRRDLALKKLGTYVDLNMHKDKAGMYVVDIKGVGPFVVGNNVEKFSVVRSKADPESGKPENAMDIESSAYAGNKVTHQIRGGKMGALVEVRDKTLNSILDRLDDLAYGLATSVNQIHAQGVTRNQQTGVNFFKTPPQKERAAEFLELSDEVKSNVNFIATGMIPDAPSDNRIALALGSLQSQKFMNDGKTTADDFFNSIISEVGVASFRNRSDLNQAKDINIQLGKLREVNSGVSIDEETTNLMQYQTAFAASAKVIQVADELLKSVLELKR